MDIIESYYNEYNDENWNYYMSYIKSSNIKLDGIPQDIVDALYSAMGIKMMDWIKAPIPALEGKAPIELLDSEKGIKALKVLIMGLPN